MVSYVGHAFQTCHVITSNKCVLLLTKLLHNCFCLMRYKRGCLSNIPLNPFSPTCATFLAELCNPI